MLFFFGCGEDDSSKNALLPEVTVKKPSKRAVTDYLDFTGNAEASDMVELRARVSGFLTKVNFVDGALVKEGDLLFEIEPEPYAAKLRLAESEVIGAQAELQRSVLEYNRQAELVRKKAAAVSEMEKWKAQRDAAQAKLTQVQAHVDLAKINFGYTQIRAPFDGRIDRTLKDPGNLVGAGEATLLSKIYRMNPIYAYFSINEKDFVKVRKPDLRNESIKVMMVTEGEEGFPHQGIIDFGSSALDENTGTLLLRGVFDNPHFGRVPKVLPGMFLRIRVPVEERPEAVLVNERAIGVDQGGRYVLTVGAEGVVDKKPVKLGALVDGLRVIEEGLSGEEAVIVRGAQQARPGSKVKPMFAENQANAASLGSAPQPVSK
jgi:RND family efflux transporter MFP subunit